MGHDRSNSVPNKTRWSFKLAGAWTPSGGPTSLYAGLNNYRNQAKFSDLTRDDDGKVAFDDSGRGLEGCAGFLGFRHQVGSAAVLGMIKYLSGENLGALDGDED